MIRFALLIGLAAHVAVAVWNGFFGPSFGAEGDAVAFHQEAIYFANNLGRFEYVTGWVYSYFLGLLYRIVSDHIFFGSMVSVFAWLGSAIFLVKAMRILDQKNIAIAIAVILYSLWPSALLNTSVTLRESFQALGVSCMIYASIACFWKNQNRWILLIFGMALSSVLHGALLAFSGSIFIFLIYYISKIRLKLGVLARLGFLFVFGGIGAGLAVALFANIAYNVEFGVLESVQNYNEGAISANARADYRTAINISGPLDFITFIPTAFFQYMMEPLPARFGNFADVSVFVENLIRMFLLIFAAYRNRRLSESERAPHTFLLLAFVGMSLIWSIGTVNWGTASRHHAPALMMIVVAACYRRGQVSRVQSTLMTAHRTATVAKFGT